MTVHTYSKKTEGTKQISPNFKVEEMVCKDGSDDVKIDDDLVVILQKIRDWANASTNINSGYRTPAHNAKVGGSPSSQHQQGKAADIVVKGKTPLEVAQYAESLGVGGIGHAPAGQGSFCHVDTRVVPCRWEYHNGGKSTKAVTTFGSAPAKPRAVNATVPIEPKSITVNGQEKRLRAALVDGENYVHLRDFVAAFGGTVSYDDATKKITVEA
ncbi:MAG: D-Ala-D-Ala carboxypeptidase family metallohydrolase [Clostridiales bacterium]|nr:D-Ala-D-Ala carboxypeptidase family metallohydrolase [Clostridiales bacterium]